MELTPKLREALQCAAAAPNATLVRGCKGFRPTGQIAERQVVTRRTANALVNAMLASFNDRTLPSAITLTPRGIETVTEFKARGGVVQVLGPYDSGNPLRFDHSRTEVPPLRRPSQRRRPAAGAI
jgi:hypothetical protein